MGLRHVCAALLVLQVWGAARAGPSAATPENALAGETRAAGQIVDRNALRNGCPPHSWPDTMSSPHELTGEWCGLQNVDVVQNATGTSDRCERTSFAAVNDQLQLILRSVKDTGEVTVEKNVTLSRLPNEGWMIRSGNKTTNLFIGLKNVHLVMCWTSIEGDAIIEDRPEMTYSVAYVRCLAPHENPADRLDVARCDLPGERT